MKTKILGFSINNKKFIVFLLGLTFLSLFNVWSLIFWTMKRIWAQHMVMFKDHILLINTDGCKIPLVYSLYIPPSQAEPLECGKNVQRQPLVTTGKNPLYPSLIFHRNVSHEYGENIACAYDVIERKNDYESNLKVKVKKIEDEVVPVDHEFVRVECLDENGTSVFEEFFSFIQRKTEVEDRCRNISLISNHKDKLNVLFLIIDSVSRNHYLKQMEKTHQYLREFFPLVEMRGFNKLGKNTFPIMTAMLTGILLEQGEVANISSETLMDPFPFIWKDFIANGYRVLFSEDMPTWGTFQYKSGGFINQPTDYYYRPFSIVYEDPNITSSNKLGCLKSQSEAEVLLKWTRDFFDVFAPDPLFALTIISYLSHNSLEWLYQYDDPVLNFFKHLNEKNHLNRTIVFFMGDHGFRYGDERLTFVGRMDAKLPFLHILFPRWFLIKYPKAVSNLEMNANRLVTVLDIHASLEDILKFPATMNESASSEGPSVSLFRGIVSGRRTCSEARIPEQFCACDERKEISVRDYRVKKAASCLLNKINGFTKNHRSKCSFFRLHAVLNAAFRTVLSDDNEIVSINYQLTIQVTPGGAIFEGMVSYLEENNLKADPYIERVNVFGHQADCIKEGLVRPFCYCRKQKYFTRSHSRPTSSKLL